MKKTLAVVAAVAFVLAGCTPSETDMQNTRNEVVANYVNYVVGEQYDKACDLLADEYVETLIAQTGQEDCESAVDVDANWIAKARDVEEGWGQSVDVVSTTDDRIVVRSTVILSLDDEKGERIVDEFSFVKDEGPRISGRVSVEQG